MIQIVLMIMTWMVSNEFRTDTKFSSVSPLDNFSQIIFASAHSFIMEKYHHLDVLLSSFSSNTLIIIFIIWGCAINFLILAKYIEPSYFCWQRKGFNKVWTSLLSDYHPTILLSSSSMQCHIHPHQCTAVTTLSIRKSLVGKLEGSLDDLQGAVP